MNGGRLWQRVRGRYERTLSTRLHRRPAVMRNVAPVISFTFDDFPRSALYTGGEILRAFGAVGTYYVALALLDRDEPVGQICSADDVASVVSEGHELGCHTYRHCDAWATRPEDFERSLSENRHALTRMLPGARFETMSYPINSPRPGTKRRTGRHFLACRGGGQKLNVGTADLNCLRAFFLEQSRERPDAIRAIIERNRIEHGWLIFATHDVGSRPSRFGCTTDLFETIVRWSVESGARILPVAQALREVCTEAKST